MNQVSIKNLKGAQKNLKAAGYSVAGWSRARGHSYWTVVRLLRGETGAKKGGPQTFKIINDLIKEGFLKTVGQHSKAA